MDVHLYWTPDSRFGFGWHYDAEDVFIFQLSGVKDYSLRKNTVFPWPTRHSLPGDMAYGREIMPLMRCTLAPGNWLYVPAGYWHKAVASEESLSLAVGVLSPTRLDVLKFLTEVLTPDIQWRERLPACGQAAAKESPQCEQGLAIVLAQIGAALNHTLRDEELPSQFLAWLRRSTTESQGALTQSQSDSNSRLSAGS